MLMLSTAGSMAWAMHSDMNSRALPEISRFNENLRLGIGFLHFLLDSCCSGLPFLLPALWAQASICTSNASSSPVSTIVSGNVTFGLFSGTECAGINRHMVGDGVATPFPVGLSE